MTDSLRIMDANFNRAREALRVMEEYARFLLDDAALAGALKQTRHGLRDALPPALRNALMHRRGITADVGRDITTPTESRRDTSAEVAVAAGRRLSEAIRVLEEYGKTIDSAAGTRLEQIRYAGYELERRIHITTHARDRFGHVRLYVLITDALCRNDWLATAEAAIRGGAQCLQLREKHQSDTELLDRAKQLTALCHDHGVTMIVNDRPDIAAASGADGVHLGQDDLPVAAARRVLPASALVGKSTHTASQIDAAIEETPDYIAIGPMFPSDTKPQAHIAGPAMLAHAQARTGLPLVAIGGVTHRNTTEVLAAASCCLSVCSGVVGAADAVAACAEYLAVVAKHDAVSLAEKEPVR